MLLKEVKEWLTEYKSLSAGEVHTFAHNLHSNDELIQALYSLFENPPFSEQELDPVCHQLYEFYRSKEPQLVQFALSYVPTLIWLYLRSLSLREQKVCGGVETFLLGLYNLEIVRSDGSPVVESFRIPSLGSASIYHEWGSGGLSGQLTENAVKALNTSHTVWQAGPFPQFETFNAQNRYSILSFVMQRYNQDLDQFDVNSLEAVCKAAFRLTNTGFINLPDNVPSEPRIVVSPALLVEILVAVRFSMCNGHSSEALKAIEAIHRRARYELHSDVLLVTNALLNAHHRGDFHFEDQRPSKINQALRSTITNASFKAKKLPDDIDFVEDEETRLATVEESETEHSGVAKGIKAKLMNIGGKLGGDRGKNRDGNTRRDSDTPAMKPGQDMMDSVDVAVMKGGGRDRVVVDMVEMQPISAGALNGNGDLNDSFDDERPGRDVSGSFREEVKAAVKNSPSPLIFSKKHGLVKGGGAGKKGSTSGQSTPSSMSYSSSPTLANNGKAAGLDNLSAQSHSPRAQSEGPAASTSREHKQTSNLTSPIPTSQPSYSSSPSLPSQIQVNSSHPNPPSSSHPPPSSQPTPSISTHSMPADIKANSSNSKNINRNSYSTDL